MIRSWPMLLVFGGLLAMPFAALAQEGAVPVAEQPGTASLADPMNGATSIGPWGGYLYFRKDFDNGIGYRNGFTNLGWFQPFEFSEESAFFAQGNLFVTDDGEVGGNLGGGYRIYSADTNSLMGAYGFLDFDESVNGHRYNQASIGAEFRGQRIDMLANAYFPFDQDERHFLALESLNGPLVASGRNLFLTGQAVFESPMPGVDFEVGFPVLDPSALGRVRGYVGAYAYDAEDKDPIGLRARVEAHINQYATVGGTVMHDDKNGALATFGVELRGWSRRLPELAHHNDYNRPKMYLPVTRQYRVAVEQFSTGDFITPALGADGLPIDFVWVNNANAAPGSGTFEDPFHDMPGSAPGADYILVYKGASSTANPVLGGIALADGQRLYGEGFEFFIDITGTKFGPGPRVVSIKDIDPAWNVIGDRPFVSNPGGSFVTLADDNEVRSFNIISSLDHGVTGNGVNNFTLLQLNIGHPNPAFGNGGAGIFLTNASGVGTIDDVVMLNNAGGGLRIQNTGAADLLLDVNGSTTVDPNVVGGLVGLELIANNSNITATVNDFLNSGSSVGAFLAATNTGTLDVDIQDSAFNDTNVGDGIRVESDSGLVVLALTDTTATNSAGDGLDIRVENNGVFTGSVAGTNLGDSSFSGAAGHGVNLLVDGTSNPFNLLTFSRTTVDGSGDDGLHIELTDGSFFDVRFEDGTIIGSGGDAIDVFEDGASTLDLLVNRSTLTDSDENGFLFNVINNSILNATLLDSDFSRSGQGGVLGAGNGIHGILDTGGVANLVLDRTDATQSAEHGLFLEVMGASTFNGDINNGDFSDSNQSGGAFDGINVFVDGVGSVATLDLIDTTVDNTFAGGGLQMNALEFLVDNGGFFSFSATETGADFTNPSSFSNALADGVFGRTHNGGVADVTFDVTTIDNSGDDGFDLLADTGSSLTVSLLNGSSTSGNAGNGILAVAATGATLNVGVDNSTVDGNFLGGIVLDASNTGTTANLAVVSSTVDNNFLGSGLDLSVTNDAVLNAFLVDSSASFNGLDGTRLLVDGAGATAPLATLIVDGFLTDGNVEDGWDVMVLGGGQLDADYTGFTGPSSSSGNGEDGFELLVDGTGTFADIDMADFAADGNGVSLALGDGNGFNILVQNDAELDLDMIGGVSGSDNQLNGFLLNATGANTIVRVNMTGTNQFDDNGLENPPGGFGILVNATGIAVLEAVVGGGSGNTLGGVEINADMVATVEDIGVAGPVNIDGNTGDGLLINLVNVTDVQNISITEASVSNNTGFGVIVLADNSPIQNVFVADNLINGNLGGDGLLFDFLNSDVSGTLEVNNNGVSNNAGNGINFELDNSSINTLNILNNGTGGGGALVGLDFSIIGNTFSLPWVITNTSQPGFDITGFTLDFAPTIGLNPPGVEWDTIEPGSSQPFEPMSNSDVLTGLSMINGTAVVPPILRVGMTTDTMDSMGTVLPGGGVPDMQGIIDLVFGDFNPGETFTWEADVDFIGIPASAVLGSDLVGTDITVNFTGGLFLAGTLQPLGFDGATFVATSGAISTPIGGNGGDGIRINQTNGSDITNLNIIGNNIDNNGQHGIEFLVDNSLLPGPGNPATISGNMITNHASGDGINLILPNTGGNPIGMDFTGNTISGNTVGINVEIDSNSPVFVSDISGNTVSNNTSFGLRVDTADNVDYTLDFGASAALNGDNLFDGNGDAGVAITSRDFALGAITVSHSAFNNSVDAADPDFNGDGFRVILNDFSRINSFTVGDGTLPRNTAFSGNAGSGLSLEIRQSTALIDPTIQTTEFIGNGADGLQIIRFAESKIDNIIVDSNLFSGNGSDGIEYRFQGGRTDIDTLGTLLINSSITSNEFDGNSGNGIFLNLDSDVFTQVDIGGATPDLGNLIVGSGSAGIRVMGAFDSTLHGTWDNNHIQGSGLDGINITLDERAIVGTLFGDFVIQNSEISTSGRDGIRIDTGNTLLTAGLPLAQVLIQDNTPQFPGDPRGIHDNSGSGLHLIASSVSTQIVGADNNFIGNNGLDGIEVDINSSATIVLAAEDNNIEGNDRHGVNFTTGDFAALGVSLIDNRIALSGQRGVSLVNTDNADTNLTIDGTVDPRPSSGVLATSRIEQNGEVGVYIENNAGAINTSNNISLSLTDTAILGNGANVGAAADDRNGVWIRVGTSTSGVVQADVQRNLMSGNGNIDFVTQSFIATPNPAVVSQYTNAGAFVPDPLARLALRLRNNEGDQIDVTRFGAFYNNADGFKSPAAFFDSSSRRRNAQRLEVSGVGPYSVGDIVQAAPAPSTTTFAGLLTPGILGNPNNTFVGLGLSIGGLRDITAYNAGNNQITFAPALGAAPAAGTPFTLLADRISGLGRSTFRTADVSIAAGGNVFTSVLSDFGTSVLIDPGNPDGNPIFGNSQTFTWSFDAASPIYIFP